MEQHNQNQNQNNNYHQNPKYISLSNQEIHNLNEIEQNNYENVQIKHFPNKSVNTQQILNENKIEELFEPFEKLEEFFPKKIPQTLEYFLINHSNLLQNNRQKSVWIMQDDLSKKMIDHIKQQKMYDQAPEIIDINPSYINYYKQFVQPIAKNIYKFNFSGQDYAAKELSYEFPINGSELKSQLQSRYQSQQLLNSHNNTQKSQQFVQKSSQQQQQSDNIHNPHQAKSNISNNVIEEEVEQEEEVDNKNSKYLEDNDEFLVEGSDIKEEQKRTSSYGGFRGSGEGQNNSGIRKSINKSKNKSEMNGKLSDINVNSQGNFSGADMKMKISSGFDLERQQIAKNQS